MNVFEITPAGEITEILDASGAGPGQALNLPLAVAVDDLQNVYVTSSSNDLVLRVTPEGDVDMVLDATGDGAGHPLGQAIGLAASPEGIAFVSGQSSDNAFSVVPFFKDGFETGDTRAWSEVFPP